MTSREIRKTFLDFFSARQHKIVDSAPLVMKNDPTLLFTNAGMNQFKDLFLGSSIATFPRIADTQKCLRVSGKHNDLDEVGIDTYHHTFFEMLGNWSFGDYFKAEAIEWAWELLNSVFNLKAEDLYVTVFEGDVAENLEKDNDAEKIWLQLISPDHIIAGNRKDNFWEMGDTGPCGPCSEIHIDLRDKKEKDLIPGKELVNKGHPQVIEVWNLVFMEYNRMSNGILQSLPQKHVDTGMGFERLCMALQGKKSNYDTDVFQPLISFISDRSKIGYGVNEKTDIAMRVLADHVRAISFSIADGQLPSNTGAGYVIRRILRRAVRYGYTFLSIREPFLFALVEVLALQFEGVFVNLGSQKDFIARVIEEEEHSFLRTLEAGISRFEKYAVGKSRIEGDFAFELYDTFGFPIDLTDLMAREKGIGIDMLVFDQELEKQRNRARNAGTVETSDWHIFDEDKAQVFTGYDSLSTQSTLIKYRKVNQKGRTLYQLVFDKSPFYAEAGGQVGDSGWIKTQDSEIQIIDTVKENNLVIHITEKDPGLSMQSSNGFFTLSVDALRRSKIESGHTATHLLQAALREVLGNHVAQKGSRVDESSLRFDFAHFSKVSDQELERVEDIVNQKIRENIKLQEQRSVPYKQAIDEGATALFGEKYGDFVRLITFGNDFSKELCGGTHVRASGNIGLFKIISEGAVAAGIRRIEALTGETAFEWLRQQTHLITAVKQVLKTTGDPLKAIESLSLEYVAAKKELEKIALSQMRLEKEEIKAGLVEKESKHVVIKLSALTSVEAIKSLSFELKNEIPNLVLVLGANIAEKPFLSIVISENLIKEKGYNASKWIREIATFIEGGGGGQPFYATAGGKNLPGLQLALDFAIKLLKGI